MTKPTVKQTNDNKDVPVEAAEQVTPLTAVDVIANPNIPDVEKLAILKQIIDEKDALIDQQAGQIADFEKANQGLSGYLVTTPNKYFNGKTMQVNFVNGRAFVPDDRENAKVVAEKLRSDFGYDVQHVDNFRDIPMVIESYQPKSVAEMLTQPASM